MDTSIQENFWDETCFAFVLQLILSYNKNKVDYLPWLRTTWLIKTKIPNTFLNSILDSPSWSLYLFSLPSTFQILSLVNGWPFLIVLLNGYKCGSWYCNCSHFTTLINISNSIYQSKGLFFATWNMFLRDRQYITFFSGYVHGEFPVAGVSLWLHRSGVKSSLWFSEVWWVLTCGLEFSSVVDFLAAAQSNKMDETVFSDLAQRWTWHVNTCNEQQNQDIPKAEKGWSEGDDSWGLWHLKAPRKDQ